MNPKTRIRVRVTPEENLGFRFGTTDHLAIAIAGDLRAVKR